MPPYTFTIGFSAVSKVYFLASELCRQKTFDTDRSTPGIGTTLTTLSLAGSVLAREGAPGIDPCRTALAELRLLIPELEAITSPELTAALADALSIFAEPAEVLAPTGLSEHPKYMHEGFSHYWSHCRSRSWS